MMEFSSLVTTVSVVTHTKKTNQRFTTSYTYDEYDRMTTQTYPSGKVIGYAYDDKGELVSIRNFRVR